MRVPKLGAAIPRRGNRLSAALGRWALQLAGWRFEGNFPDVPKCVIIVAPHTSNWDFPVGLAVMFAVGMRASWVGKHTLFRPASSSLMRWLGGIPADRTAPHGLVGGLVEEFRHRDGLFLVIAPEGTRKKVTEWKSGFHRIALGAGVPIAPVAFDYGTKTIHLLPSFAATTDYEADLAALQAKFVPFKAKRPSHR
ncbi:MAG: lysophospholipid acyltransferase family protein [Deltaproteobacteria bacterium]|nr:lysophospholipid acyltransferase family protein [Deltaproteobacteria bacterium]